MVRTREDKLNYQREYNKTHKEKLSEYNRKYYLKQREKKGLKPRIKKPIEEKPINHQKLIKVCATTNTYKRRLIINKTRINDKPPEGVIETENGFLVKII